MKHSTHQPPLYVQLEMMLMKQIRHRYRAGELLPTQQEIANQNGVSLITVKRALDEIARRGLIEAIRGRGTFVCPTGVADKRSEVTTWKDCTTGLSAIPRTAWMRINKQIPSKESAHILGMKVRSKSVLVERLRTMEGKPICFSSHELPLAMVPNLPKYGFTEESFYSHLLKEYDLRPHSASEVVTSRHATTEERKMLGQDTELVMVVRRYTYLKDGRPLEIVKGVLPAHRYQYRVRVMTGL